MKKTLYLNVVDSHGEIFHGEIKDVTLSGTMGGFTVLPGHTPLISSLKPGEIYYSMIDGGGESLFVSGGVVEVQPTIVTVLADTIIRSDDLDEKKAQESMQRAKQKIKQVDKGSEAYVEILKEMQMMKALLQMTKITNQHRIRR